jgi:tRNA/tmRNA/rRNA uracil-C5-methylase (TrmA/RlmC/RlmD family)
MQYSQQLFYKNQEVYNNLKRIGKIELPEFEPILGSEKQFFYRNKMEFGFSNARWMTDAEIQSGTELDNKNALGFHIPRMWDKILDIYNCHLQQDPSNEIRNEIKRFANENGLTFFNARNHEGLLRTLMIRTATGEIMVLVQFFKENKTPLFSSHMLDLSEEPIEENLHICADYFKRMNRIQTGIEIELGVTGGEEDGVDNSDVDSARPTAVQITAVSGRLCLP